MGKKLEGALVTLVLLTIICGYVLSFFQWEDNSKQFGKPLNLSPEDRRQIKETLLKENGDVSDPQILKMIGYHIRQAEVCWDCRELQEWERGSMYMLYPVIGHRVQHGEVLYTLVIGQIGWHAGEPGRMYVAPKSAIYSDHGGDGISRIANNVTISGSRGFSWRPVKPPSAEEKMRREAILALQKSIVQTF